MAKQEYGRVVVRRKRTYSESNHGGSWKIAYSDFMTAMMAFFLVMWLLLLVPKNDLTAIAEYFRTPLMTAVTGGPRLDTSHSPIPGGDPSVIPNPYPLPGQPNSFDLDSPDRQSDTEDQENLENLKRNLENLIEHNPVLQQFRPQLLLDMTPDGLRIQILDQQNRPMFALGSAIIQTYMRDILRELAPPINDLPNSITISGHTDAMRYASGDRSYSNWELSADRANAARRELVLGGLVENKVKRILGMGETVNLIRGDPMAAVNRRISILVLNRQAEWRIDRQNAAGLNDAQIRQRLEQLRNPQSGLLLDEYPPEQASLTGSKAGRPSLDLQSDAIAADAAQPERDAAGPASVATPRANNADGAQPEHDPADSASASTRLGNGTNAGRAAPLLEPSFAGQAAENGDAATPAAATHSSTNGQAGDIL